MSTPVTDLLATVRFAATAHANQRRKGATQEPYINHLLEVAELVAAACKGLDFEVIQAAVLHDVVEDTRYGIGDVAERFGEAVAGLVAECSDDMSLPKEERKRRRIEKAGSRSPHAKLIKTADLISNLRAMAESPPAGWPPEWRLGYLGTARAVHAAMGGTVPLLDGLFEREAARVEEIIRADAADLIHGNAKTRAPAPEPAAGQPVNIVYLPNTEVATIDEGYKDRVAHVVGEFFPSFTMQEGDGVYEGRRRPMLLLRIRSDATSAVVALAQRLCVVFGERFVGIETERRYLRIYADDTA
ncbi:MAG: HD domain-containing protein [Geminicoccaceae bacterium]